MTEYVYDMSDPERDALTEHFLSTKKLGCSRFACFAVESTDVFATSRDGSSARYSRTPGATTPPP